MYFYDVSLSSSPEQEIFQSPPPPQKKKNCRENQNTFFLQRHFFENRPVYEIMWQKYCTSWGITDDNTAHALWMLDNQGYKHTLRIRDTPCFSTTTMTARTRLNVTLYVH